MEWEKHVVEAIAPSLVGHQGYDAKAQKICLQQKPSEFGYQRMKA